MGGEACAPPAFCTARKCSPARPVSNLKILSRTGQGPEDGRAASEETAALPGPGRGGTVVVGTESDVSGDGRSLARLCATSGTGELLVAWIAWHVIEDASNPGAGLAAWGRSHSRRPSPGRSGPSSVLAAELRRAARSPDAFSFAGLRSRRPRAHTPRLFSSYLFRVGQNRLPKGGSWRHADLPLPTCRGRTRPNAERETTAPPLVFRGAGKKWLTIFIFRADTQT